MTLPPPDDRRRVPRAQRPIVFAAVLGGGACLFAVIVAVTLLGLNQEGINEAATTGLVGIGSTLAGGFAAWIGARVHGGPDR